jgi:hypothetical protein
VIFEVGFIAASAQQRLDHVRHQYRYLVNVPPAQQSPFPAHPGHPPHRQEPVHGNPPPPTLDRFVDQRPRRRQALHRQPIRRRRDTPVGPVLRHRDAPPPLDLTHEEQTMPLALRKQHNQALPLQRMERMSDHQ